MEQDTKDQPIIIVKMHYKNGECDAEKVCEGLVELVVDEICA